MNIKDQGYFWLAGKDGEAQIPGLLAIDSEGKISLELQRALPGRRSHEIIFSSHSLLEKSIEGRLKNQGKHVLLKGLRSTGGQIGTTTYEHFSADECLISFEPIQTNQFEKISISLDGLQGWLSPGEIITSYDDLNNNKTLVQIGCHEQKTWQTSQGTVKIQHHLKGLPPAPYSHQVKISMSSLLTYTPLSAMSSEDLKSWYFAIQDLILIFINDNFTFPRPRIFWTNKEQKDSSADYYFPHQESKETGITRHNTTLPFTRIQEDFGNIIDSWFQNREHLGPGLHLYLATRRDQPLYLEHRFVNLVWGLETLARRLSSDTIVDSSDKAKRIISAIETSTLNSKDKRWVKNILTRSAEPTLSERLFDIFKPIALDISDKNLRNFCKEVSELRNDLSHFGGERQAGDSDTFIHKVLKNINALSNLYLLVLLHRLGLTNNHLHFITYTSQNALKHSFEEAGLIPPKKRYLCVRAPHPNE